MAERRLRTVALAVTMVVLVTTGGSAVGAATSPATAAAESPTEPAFLIDLEPDGDATVTLVVIYDLADDSDRQAFEALRDDPPEITGEFEQRLSRIANQTATDTGREMSVSGADATFETVDERGVVRVSAQWSQLASVSGEQLTLSEPFTSEFQPDRLFVVHSPDGYELTETSHTPAEQGSETVQWKSGTNLSGFSTTFTAGGLTSLDESLSTPLLVLLAFGLLVVVGYVGRRQLR